ncbi:2-keto-4-pentenoate hydratase [Chloroflexus sp.]|uniref:2-keto-4-pentenoate hydratase n=1 Tax=Chloroflexus sp. TaxID=1904827 RepID=UPI00298F0267|nr:fumarylacetoacetate hydrolase family protein [Chloroflexus sp.]MCS6887679.1 fumarylacetoacetate hydrolase family protein [Chloroflexus sp.]MDW8404280.1 fumarylacetoacetate hydrolase family protein [Chloroflexus sp.]
MDHAEDILAKAIEQARATRRPLASRAAEWGVDLAGAYRIQRARLPDERCIGYKLGLISPAKQRQMGLNQPIYGRISRAMIRERVVNLSDFGQPRLEPELAVVLRSPLPADAEPGAATRAVGGIFLGVDILDSAWADYRFSAVEVVADNASGGGFLLGERLHEQMPDGELRLYLNGELRAAGPVAALGNLAQQLCWLAQAVDGLGAGQIIFLGSPAQAIPATPGVLEVVIGDDIVQAQLEGAV